MSLQFQVIFLDNDFCWPANQIEIKTLIYSVREI